MVPSQLARRLCGIAERAAISLQVTFADGRSLGHRRSAATDAIGLRFNSAAAQWRAVLFGHIGLLDAHFDGDIDIDGDLASVFRLGLESGYSRPMLGVRLRNRWHELRRNNADRVRAKLNARFHYGLGADFYRRWLDRDLLMYTCG